MGKKADGSVKPMFDGAVKFHQSLYINNEHIIKNSDVNVYTLSGSNYNTKTTVILNSSYEIVDFEYSPDGDGIVLRRSAGFGTPYKNYPNVSHIGLVSNNMVISDVISIINNEISALNTVNYTSILTQTNLIEAEAVPTTNDRGWPLGLDNRRINIYADCSGVLSYNGETVIEYAEKAYTTNGNILGDVWQLGNTGRKMYVLYDGEYMLKNSSQVLVKYMNNGYYDKIVEITNDDIDINVIVRDYSSKEILCQSQNGINSNVSFLLYTYTTEEIASLNE